MALQGRGWCCSVPVCEWACVVEGWTDSLVSSLPQGWAPELGAWGGGWRIVFVGYASLHYFSMGGTLTALFFYSLLNSLKAVPLLARTGHFHLPVPGGCL